MGTDEKYDICIQCVSDGEYYPLKKIAEINIDATDSDNEPADLFVTDAVSLSITVNFNRKSLKKSLPKALRSAEVWFSKKNRRLRRKRRIEKRFRKENRK